MVTLGPKETETNLRSALATGADRAIRVETTDDELDGRLVALALKKIVEEEKPDAVIMGKQVVDSESNFVGQALAELLDWPMATFAATIKEEAGALLVGREVDGGVMTARLKLPARGHGRSSHRLARQRLLAEDRGRLPLPVRRGALCSAARDHAGEKEAARRQGTQGRRGGCRS